jgi:hypothetical protein
MKQLHLFWGRSRPLSWLRLQTVETFARLNPTWRITVWWRDVEPVAPYWSTHEQQTPYTGRDYFRELDKIPTVNVEFEPIYRALPDVPFSDYLRWWLLTFRGGFWSDFDIVYVKPMPEVSDGPWLTRYPCGTFPIGFLGAVGEEGQMFFARCLEEAQHAKGTDYQQFGCKLLGMVAKHVTPQPPIVYPEWQPTKARINYFESTTYQVPDEFIGLHWYAGADFAARFENDMKEDAAIMQAIRRVMS